MKQKQVEADVKAILEDHADARGDDHVLYYWYATGKCFVPFSTAFILHKKLGLTSLEGISRARRRVQKKYPELRSDTETEAARNREEEEFHEYYSEENDGKH